MREWIGKSETRSDRVTLTPIAALSATLDRDDPFPREGDPLPPLWHWLYFLPIHRQSELGPDGHAKRGGFLPPVPLPHRMFASGRLRFHRALRAGETIHRLSRIADVIQKSGRNGPLVFVIVRHEITLNPHRIHYDWRHTDLEGYPGLVVHGPLNATLLADLARRNLPDALITSFSFRAVKPLLDTDGFVIGGGLVDQLSSTAICLLHFCTNPCGRFKTGHSHFAATLLQESLTNSGAGYIDRLNRSGWWE